MRAAPGAHRYSVFPSASPHARLCGCFGETMVTRCFPSSDRSRVRPVQRHTEYRCGLPSFRRAHFCKTQATMSRNKPIPDPTSILASGDPTGASEEGEAAGGDHNKGADARYAESNGTCGRHFEPAWAGVAASAVEAPALATPWPPCRLSPLTPTQRSSTHTRSSSATLHA